MLGLSGSPLAVLYVAQQVNPSAGVDLWPNPIIAACAVLVVLAVYVLLGLIFSWPLPGGRDDPFESVTESDTDEDVATECLTLAQSMWDLLASAQRDAPYLAPSVPLSESDPEALDRSWQRSQQLLHDHENKLLGQFLERFGVRLSGVLQALVSRGQITDDEVQSLWHRTSSTHWLAEVPRTLAAIGHRLGAHS